ncbi:MAG: HD domain-containing protein [Opitutales bacterium]|nr:HD domain-containing protein [Opitutales bacterium]NRA27060.1 HD domain-containing protein [Opitutales bacterium]
MRLYSSERLRQQIAFIKEIDALKGVTRRSLLLSRERYENSAEHSWHIALLAMIMTEYCPEELNTQHTVKLLLIHDIVEIDAGDVFIYDSEGQANKTDDEEAACERIFGLLPDDQAQHFKALWQEFEHGKTPEAIFARSIDRLMPLLHNYFNEGAAWKKHGVVYDQVIEVNSKIAEGSPKLWEFAQGLINDAVAQGWLSH